jgi:hypothetical protein
MNVNEIRSASVNQAQSAQHNDTPASAGALEEPSAMGYSALSAVDIVEQLAKLILKTVAAERDTAKTQKKMLRDEQYRNEESQVQSMRDKAGAIMDGAIASGLCSIGSGACSVYDATRAAPQDPADQNEPMDATKASKWQSVPGAIARPMGDMSNMAGKMFGDSPAASHDADAKAAELAAQRAKDCASDQNDRLGELSSLAQDAMQAIRSAQASQNEMVQGILRRM